MKADFLVTDKKYIEQEGCASKSALLKALRNRQVTKVMYDIVEHELSYLPPVQPKIKVGHWIEGQTDNPNIHNILCSCCFEGYPSKGHANSQYTKEKFQWCPKCGARMIDTPDINDKKLSEIPTGSESEDKE